MLCSQEQFIQYNMFLEFYVSAKCSHNNTALSG